MSAAAINYRVRMFVHGILTEMKTELPYTEAEDYFDSVKLVFGGCVVLDELQWEEFEFGGLILRHCQTIKFRSGTRPPKIVKEPKPKKEKAPVPETKPTRSRNQQKKLQRGR